MRKLVNAVLGAVATVAAPNAFGADGGLPGATTPATTDRAAVERIYYEHRLGTEPAFEQALPPAQIEKMVKLDLKKKAVLKRVYKIDIKQWDVDSKVQRINSTTRAPEVTNVRIVANCGLKPRNANVVTSGQSPIQRFNGFSFFRVTSRQVSGSTPVNGHKWLPSQEARRPKQQEEISS